MKDNNDQIARIENKLDKIVDKIGQIDSTLAAQHVSLVEHIRRTDILEEKLDPIETHVNMVQGALKALVVSGILAGCVEGIVSLLSYVRK